MEYVFALVIQVCSLAFGCATPGVTPELYETRYECALAGYDTSKSIHISLHNSLPEPEKIGIYVKFWCDNIPKSDI